MNPTRKKAWRDAAVVFCLLAVSIGFHCVTYSWSGRMLFPVRGLHRFVYEGLILAWGISAEYRSTTKFMRRCFWVMDGLMLFYLTVQLCKYEFFCTMPAVCRCLWYAYYIPMLLLPALLFLCSLCVGRQEAHVPRRVMYALFLPALVLIAAVLTNDWHQQVFRFAADMRGWESDYRYGPVYYAVVLWIGGLIAATIWTLFHRCRITRSRRLALIPLFWVLFSAAYLLFFTTPFFTGMRIFQLPEAFCFLIIILCESLMRTGLLPSNTHYAALFSASTIHARILDWNGKICYRSAQADDAPDENRRFHSLNIGPGRLQWTEDIRIIRKLNGELAEARQQLTEENELIQAENSLAEERVRTEAKQNLYATIGTVIQPQLQAIDRLLDGLKPDGDDWEARMALACVYNAYVKRRSNLELIAQRRQTLPAEELALCLRESLDYILLCGIECELDFRLKAELDAGMVKGLYAGFEAALEAALPELRSLLVSAQRTEGLVNLRLCMSGVGERSIAAPEGTVIETELEDDCLYIAIAAERGGGV